MQNKMKVLYDRNKPVWTAMIVVIMILFGLLVGYVPKALASSDQRICTHNPDMTCAVTAPQGQRLFKNGHYKRADGVSWHRITTHPHRIRAVIRHKFAVYYMHASRAKKRAIRERYNLHFSTAKDIDGGCSFGWGMAKCAAGHLLGGLNRVSCESSDPYANIDDDSCVTITGILGLHHGNGLTKTQVQKGGQVGFCGAGSMLLVQRAASTASEPGAVFAAGLGAASCIWTAWSLFDS